MSVTNRCLMVIVAIAALVWHTGFRIAAAAGIPRTERNERSVSLVVSGAVLAAGLYWLGQRLAGF